MITAAYPYEVQRVVRWGDCDPAGIIYTPRAIEFGIEALEAWFRDVLDASWASLPAKYAMGSPVVHVECDFVAQLAADQKVTLNVLVERLGGASLTFSVRCTDGAARGFFTVGIVMCCLALPERRPRPVPETLRERIEAYIVGCNDDERP